jgi:hypothetical protein
MTSWKPLVHVLCTKPAGSSLSVFCIAASRCVARVHQFLDIVVRRLNTSLSQVYWLVIIIIITWLYSPSRALASPFGVS